MHHQKSSSDSPFHANTGTPARNKTHTANGCDGEQSRGLKTAHAPDPLEQHHAVNMCRLDAVWFQVLFGFMQRYCHNKCLNQNYTQQHFLCITDKICFSSQQRPKVRSIRLSREEDLTCFSESSSHLILSGVDVTGSPATLSPEGDQGFNQDLRGNHRIYSYMERSQW